MFDPEPMFTAGGPKFEVAVRRKIVPDRGKAGGFVECVKMRASVERAKEG